MRKANFIQVTTTVAILIVAIILLSFGPGTSFGEESPADTRPALVVSHRVEFQSPDASTPSWMDLGWYLIGLPSDLQDAPPDYVPADNPPPNVIVVVNTEPSFAGQEVHFETTKGVLSGGDVGVLQQSSDGSVAWYQDQFLPEGVGKTSVTAILGFARATVEVPVIGPPLMDGPTDGLKPGEPASATAMTDGTMSGCLATQTQGMGIQVVAVELEGQVMLEFDGTSTGWLPYIGNTGSTDWVTMNITVREDSPAGSSVTLRCEDVYQQIGSLTLTVS